MINRVIYRFLLVFVTIAIAGNAYGQEPIFSISNQSDTYLNPANTFNAFTTDTYLKLNVQFRDQWNSISSGDNYATSKLQAEYNVYESQNDAWNIGVIFLSDQSSARSLGFTSFQFLGAYTRKLSEGRKNRNLQMISLGGSFGINQLSSDVGDLFFGRQFNLNTFSIDRDLMSGEEFRNEAFNYNSINLGARWTYIIDEDVHYSAGLSVSNVNSPSVSSQNSDFSIDPRIILQAEGSLALSDGFQHRPSLIFVSQSNFWQFVPAYGVTLDINSDEDDFSLLGGVGLRMVNSIESIMADAVLFNVGLRSSKWSFSFNFDMNVSSLRTFTSSNGAIELTLGYNLMSN
ncbi:type IX secretion system membrane protein PorP/SprF [Saprospiraceae bacterium]|nr:type IX secretion system membrane protein PorP/SprF [Saprospiraceae bacterium]